MRRSAAALLLLAVAAPGAGAEDFRAHAEPGGTPTFVAAGVVATLAAQSPEVLTWELRTDLTALDGLVEVRGWFDVPRPRQVVPESRTAGAPDDDWHQFFEVDNATIPDRPEGARNVNLSGDARNLTLRLAFPVNATTHAATLRLRRDVAAPVFALGPPRDVGHFSFYVETTTDEPALATLRVRPAAGGAEVPLPTTVASRLQRFPVQGLDADADYVFRVTFEDWSGNTATSPDVPVHTAPKPVRPAPRVTGRTPEANATVPERVGLVAVTFEGPAPRDLRDVLAFVDKAAQPAQALALLPGRVEVHVAPPLGPGKHSVGIELTSAEGGTALAAWSFTVAGPTPLPAGLAFVGLAVAGLLAVRRRAQG